jgi:hypothetical protein
LARQIHLKEENFANERKEAIMEKGGEKGRKDQKDQKEWPR